MAIKELQTRIALKYDSYSNWTSSPGKDLILLKGEIGICEIPPLSTEATTAPTVLFKIGDGTSTFEKLKWASALAADVYSWAKAEEVVLDGTAIKFKTDDTIVHSIDLSDLTTEISASIEALAERISNLENTEDGESVTTEQYEALEQRLDTLEGADTVDGSVAKAIKDAVANLTAKSTHEELAATVAALNRALQVEEYSREQADVALEAKLGEGFSGTTTVKAAIDAAKELGQQGINDAAAVQSALTALTNGQVATNTSAIAELTNTVDAAIEALEEVDTALDNRLKGIEAFFEAADHDGENGGLKDALDTLVEIQDYLSGEGSATGGLLSRIAAAEDDIKALESTLATGGDFNKRVAAAEGGISANAEAIEALQKLTADYSGEGAIKAAIDKAQEDATKGINDAAVAQSTATEAKTAAANVKSQADNLSTLLAGVSNKANTTEANLAELTTRVVTAETDITNLKTSVSGIQAIVDTGENSNAKLRQAIVDLQSLTGANGSLQSELAKLKEDIETNKTSISEAESRLAQIEQDYLTSVDEFIFQCGSSSEVVHEAPKTSN